MSNFIPYDGHFIPYDMMASNDLSIFLSQIKFTKVKTIVIINLPYKTKKKSRKKKPWNEHWEQSGTNV